MGEEKSDNLPVYEQSANGNNLDSSNIVMDYLSTAVAQTHLNMERQENENMDTKHKTSFHCHQNAFRPIKRDNELEQYGVSPPSGSYLRPNFKIKSSAGIGWSCHSLSPSPQRRRANTYSVGQMRRPVSAQERRVSAFCSAPSSPSRMPRDAQQPTRGSISDISDR